MKIHVTDLGGETHALDARPGKTLMEAIRDSALPIVAQCGGCAACGTCHVHVDEAWREKLPRRQDIEEDMLDMSADFLPDSRLSCQIELTADLDGLTVVLSEDAVYG